MPVMLIAEAGCNHKGDMSVARDMIAIAAVYCHVDAIKFQKRCNRELLTAEQYMMPHPNPVHAYGQTYGEHREFLEFSVDQHRQLKEWCDEYGITYSSSVWDLTSAKEIAALCPKFIKIPSASNTNYPMLQWLCEHYEGEMQVSLGMTTQAEEEQIVQLFEKNSRQQDLVLLSCTSGYPISPQDACLLEIKRLVETYGHSVKSIGYSGHHQGRALDIAACILGAKTIERHYTLDKNWKGTDHSASLEPNELKELVQDIRSVQESLTYKPYEILPVELPQVSKLKYRRDGS